MSRRIEIHLAPHRMARVETWVNDRCTAMTGVLSLENARMEAKLMAGENIEIVDHTEHELRRVSR